MESKNVLFITACVVLFLLCSSGVVEASGNDIIIGGLSPGGDRQSQVPEILAGWDIAIDDMNSYYEQARIPINLHLVTSDAGNEETSVENTTQDLYMKGVNLFVGPFSGAETERISEFLKEEQVISIGAGSSVNSSYEGDTIFSLLPDNEARIHALQSFWEVENDSIPIIIPFGRDDCLNETGYDTDLISLIQQEPDRFASPVSYSANTTDYQEALMLLVDHVQAVKATHPGVPIAVMIIGYDEIPEVLHQAKAYPDLADLLWCGFESFLDPAIPSDHNAAAFAEETHYSVAAFAGEIESTAFTDDVKQRIESRTGNPATMQGLTAYDQVILAGMMIKDGQYLPSDEYKQIVPQVAAFLHGATGSLILDKDGNRAAKQFMIWQVHKDENGTEQWIPVAIAGEHYAALLPDTP